MEKLIMITRSSVNIGAIGGAIVLLSGQDPFEFETSSDLLQHFELGVVLSLPLVAMAMLLRLIRPNQPVVTALHEHQLAIIRPITKDLNASQHLIVASSTWIALLILLLPAASGVYGLAESAAYEFVLTPAGVSLPVHWQQSLSFLIPTLLSSFIAASLTRNALLVNDDQLEKLCDAYKRSDAWFCLAESQSRLMDGATEIDAKEASEAFKDIVSLWFIERVQTANLSFYLTFVNISWISLSWHMTNDFITPLTVSMIWTLTELLLTEVLSQEKEMSRV